MVRDATASRRQRGQGDPRGLDPGLSANSRAGRSVAVMTVDASQIGLFWVREWRLSRPVNNVWSIASAFKELAESRGIRITNGLGDS